MCWKNTMNLYNSHGLPYMVMEYLKMKGVTSAGCFDIAKGSHNLSFFAPQIMMNDLLASVKNHETPTHKLYFMPDKYPGKYHCNCVKIKE